MSDCQFLQVQAPPPLKVAVKLAADRELTTVSEFIRRTLIERLRAVGIDPAKIDHDAAVAKSIAA
jgi:hypothetical protein